VQGRVSSGCLAILHVALGLILAATEGIGEVEDGTGRRAVNIRGQTGAVDQVVEPVIPVSVAAYLELDLLILVGFLVISDFLVVLVDVGLGCFNLGVASLPVRGSGITLDAVASG
jgi:hypothetical protein